MVHVGICGRKSWVLFQIGQQGLTHLQDGRGTRRRPVHAPQQLLPRRLYGLEQMDQAGLVAFSVVFVGGIQNHGRVRVELAGQEMEKIDLAALVQVLVMVDQLDGHALRIGLSPCTEQLFGAELGGIQLLVLNEAFQHGGLWCLGSWFDLMPIEITLTAYTSQNINSLFLPLKHGDGVK